jgi:hypothetical protein
VGVANVLLVDEFFLPILFIEYLSGYSYPDPDGYIESI